MYSQFFKHKPKPKIDPMKMDFGFMIKNHPEFFTKLSSRDNLAESARRPPPASGAFLLLGWLTFVSRSAEQDTGGWEA
jgi:hypothetical protein